MASSQFYELLNKGHLPDVEENAIVGTSAAISGNATVGGTLGVTGAVSGAAGSFTTVTSTAGLVVGTSGVPIVKAAAGNISSTYGTASHTTGDVRLLYSKLNFTGAGGSGETLRAFTTVAAAVAVGGTVNGGHISLSVNTGGSVSGEGNALRATLGAAASVTVGGTLAVITADSDLASGAVVPAGTAFFRAADTNTVTITKLLNVPAVASGGMVAAHTTDAMTHSIRCITATGTVFYLMCTTTSSNRTGGA